MELNDYSARFFAVLLRTFPEFGKLAEAEANCFTVEFSTPSGAHVYVSTEEFGRITVGRSASHVHFGGWAESVDDQDFAAAVGYIRSLLGE